MKTPGRLSVTLLAAAAQAQVAKTPEKPAVQSTQAVQPQVAPKDAAKPGDPVAKETVKPGCGYMYVA